MKSHGAVGKAPISTGHTSTLRAAGSRALGLPGPPGVGGREGDGRLFSEVGGFFRRWEVFRRSQTSVLSVPAPRGRLCSELRIRRDAPGKDGCPAVGGCSPKDVLPSPFPRGREDGPVNRAELPPGPRGRAVSSRDSLPAHPRPAGTALSLWGCRKKRSLRDGNPAPCLLERSAEVMLGCTVMGRVIWVCWSLPLSHGRKEQRKAQGIWGWPDRSVGLLWCKTGNGAETTGPGS